MVSPSAIGVEAKAPNELVPGIANRHATFRPATVRASIGVRVVALVLPRSRLCAGHPPAFAAHSGGGSPAASRAGEDAAHGAGERERGEHEGREPAQNAITARNASPRAADPSASLMAESGERDEISSSSRRRPSR